MRGARRRRPSAAGVLQVLEGDGRGMKIDRHTKGVIRRMLAVAGIVTAVMLALWLGSAAQAADGDVAASAWIDALPRWTTAGLAIGSLGLVILTLYLSTRFASKVDVETMGAVQSSLARKVDRLEADFGALPKSAEHQDLVRQIERVQSQVQTLPKKDEHHELARVVERQNGQLQALAATLAPIAASVVRIETFLLEHKGTRGS